MPFIDHQRLDHQDTCNHPEHNPPTMIELPSGIHTWQCPACMEIQKIEIPDKRM